MQRLPFTTLILSFSYLILGQHSPNLYGFTKANNIEVIQNGKSLKFPWTGGINSAHVNTIDLNRDGIQDLVLFDKNGKNFHTYVTKNSAGNTYYEYAPEYENFFPNVNHSNDWALIRDYNCDGKKDLFFGFKSNIYVWQNTSGNALSFSPFNNGDYLESFQYGYSSNLYIGGVNLPGIADIDGDGALDVLTFSNQSIEMELHKGKTPCGLNFELEERCWGHFTETGYAPGVNLNACTPHKKKTMDGSTTILPIDLDGDQVQDLILGNGTYTSLAALYNGGSPDSAHMISQNKFYPTSHPIKIPSTPGAFYEDVDHDGLKDLLVSPSTVQDAYCINKNSLHFYKNTGSSSTPVFTFQQEDFLQNEMIDVGERSVPRLADLNGDSLPDLIVSNYEYHLKDSIIGHSYHYYQNTSSATNTSFTLIDTNFMDISSHGIKAGSIPAFGDLDGDGDLDAVVGDMSGTLYYFTNSSQTAPSFSFHSTLLSINESFAAPFLYDIDSNGTLDLFVGNIKGTIHYYSNASTAFPNFTLKNTRWGGVHTKGNASYGHSIPYLFKHNGLDNLFVGSDNAGIFQFDSIQQIMGKPSLLQPAIGNGTIVSSGPDETPFGTKRKNGRNQFLIRSSELRQAGLVSGYIDAISFKIMSSPNNDISKLFLKMKSTNDSVLNGFQTGMTDVKGDINDDFKTGWKIFNFTTSFLWDGASNIIIETCFKGQPASNNVDVEMTDVGFNANAYGDYIDPSMLGNGCAQPYLASSTKRPNMQIILTPTFAHTENYATGLHTAPAVADLNNDGFLDMLVGNMNGGLNYYNGKIYDVGLAEPQNQSPTSLNVFPNPGNGRYTISTPNMGKATIGVFDLSGKLLLTQEVNSDESTIDLQNQPDGMYLFILQGEGELRTAKVIKQ